ncbi:MAG: leucine-rich repeat domain-containing protein [Clostridia bacterium]|nr:leucine-rich repeat domain-containing protein [Clostridia bacterium]
MKPKSFFMIMLLSIIVLLSVAGCQSLQTGNAKMKDEDGYGETPDGFVYYHVALEKVIIYDYKGALTQVTIPDQINGTTVTTLADVFQGNRDIISVTIPEGVEYLCETFDGCTNLQTVNLPQSLLEIGENTFRGCANITEINIPDSVKKIGKKAFTSCSSLTGIIFPEGVSELSASAFSGCSSMVEINIPSSVKIIGNQAFSNCSALAKVTLPDDIWLEKGVFDNTPWRRGITGTYVALSNTLVEINLDADVKDIVIPENIKYISLDTPIKAIESVFFPASIYDIKAMLTSAENLNSISVDENNPWFSSEDGVLYNKEKTVLVFYPPAKEGEAYEAAENMKYSLNWNDWGEAKTLILPENFFSDFNTIASALAVCPLTEQFNFSADNERSGDQYYYRTFVFQFVRNNGWNRASSTEGYLENLFFRGDVPDNAEAITNILKGYDSELNIVWGYDG